VGAFYGKQIQKGTLLGRFALHSARW